jgi:uncharacterized caspase-like protein
MANWAISIGINSYSNLQHLNYAKRDAEGMHNWFKEKAKFDQVFLFTEDSPPIATAPSPILTTPTYGHLRRFLRAQFETKLLKNGDNLWFFFAGHGIRAADGDYLMLSDSDPGDVESTALSVNFITERLRRCGADNVVLFLDACRNEGDRNGLGIGTDQHQGVITFYSCAPNQKSYEIDDLQHGSFTKALLDGLQIQGEGNCATVERLEHYLQHQVPQINQSYKKNVQNPCVKVEPSCKRYFILLKQFASINDTIQLKFKASLAENHGDLLSAEQLWIQVLATSPADFDAIKAIKRITLKNFNQPGTALDLPTVPNISDIKSQRSSLKIELCSERGVDYTTLEKLLAAGKWREADEKTARVMCLAAGREKEGYLQQEDIDNFPCEDLRTINQLWLHYSNGQFGFSVQKEIYQSLGGTKEYNYEVWKKFCDQVGWVVKGEWLSYEDVTFNLSASPGHLPISSFGDRGDGVTFCECFCLLLGRPQE